MQACVFVVFREITLSSCIYMYICIYICDKLHRMRALACTSKTKQQHRPIDRTQSAQARARLRSADERKEASARPFIIVRGTTHGGVGAALCDWEACAAVQRTGAARMKYAIRNIFYITYALVYPPKNLSTAACASLHRTPNNRPNKKMKEII